MKKADLSKLKIIPARKVDNPDKYSVPHDVMCLIWIALDETGNTELSRLVASTMQAQGCDELDNADFQQVLSFWSEYLEDKLTSIKKETH